MKQISSKESHYYESFKDFLQDTAVRFEGRTAITTYDRKGTPKGISYEQMKDDAFAVARALYANGLSGSMWQYWEKIPMSGWLCILAFAVSGGTAVCIDTEHTDEIIIRMITQADAQPSLYPSL